MKERTLLMGADAFVVYFGVRDTIPCNDAEQIELLEERKHWTQQRARDNGLNHLWGRLTDGVDYHILLGKEIGTFGVENTHEASVQSEDLHRLMGDVQAKFEQMGIKEAPSLLFQLEAQY